MKGHRTLYTKYALIRGLPGEGMEPAKSDGAALWAVAATIRDAFDTGSEHLTALAAACALSLGKNINGREIIYLNSDGIAAPPVKNEVQEPVEKVTPPTKR